MRRPTKLPPIEVIEASFVYDPVTGDLIRRKTGRPVRCHDRQSGQMKVKVGRKSTTVQRICWMLFYREDPIDKIIKHKDDNPFNNRIENLTSVKI